MYELIKLNEKDYYIECPSRIGIVKTAEDKVVFIDSGNNRDAGKKALRIIEEQGWTLEAIFNTHSHADHIGGNRYLQEKTGCRIFAKGAECFAVNYPESEPALLYGGFPYGSIKHKFLMAEKSFCEPLCEEVLPAGMKIIDLPGHCFDMTGFLTENKTAYIGDAVISEDILKKYGMAYNWDVSGYLKSLETVKGINADIFVTSHCGNFTEITEIADYNISHTKAVEQTVISLCLKPISFENLLKAVFDNYGLTMTAEQNILVGSTLRAYIAKALDDGKLKYFSSENIMYFEAIS